MEIPYDSPLSGGAAWFWIRFVLAVLATWRLSHLLAAEDGPWGVIAKFRMRLRSSAIGRMLDCFGCVSIWVAALMSGFVFRRLPELVVCWLALSGAAFLLERMLPEPLMIERISETAETKEDNHGMLR